MTTINPSAPTGPVATADWQATNGLTAEGLLAYCSSRLNSLDDLIQSRFAEQQKRNDGLKEAGALLNVLNGHTDLTNTANADTREWMKSMGAGLAKMYCESKDPDVREKICEAYQKFTGNQLKGDGKGGVEPWQLDPKNITLGPDVKDIPKDDWQSFVGTVKTIQDGLSKDSELSMIQLQSVISQRQLAVQTTTQMMSTMNDSMKQVINNFKS